MPPLFTSKLRRANWAYVAHVFPSIAAFDVSVLAIFLSLSFGAAGTIQSFNLSDDQCAGAH